jgi:Na+/melibiose symporter-like transporter
MVAGAWTMVAALLAIAVTVFTAGLSWPVLLVVWLVIGLGYSTVQTPSGRLLRRSAHAEDRPAVFAAQFALSHACWLITYPLSGWLMTIFGTVPALVVLAGVATFGIVAALRLWPAGDPDIVEHTHENLPLDHPHLQGHRHHAHALVIDDAHPRWGSQF